MELQMKQMKQITNNIINEIQIMKRDVKTISFMLYKLEHKQSIFQENKELIQKLNNIIITHYKDANLNYDEEQILFGINIIINKSKNTEQSVRIAYKMKLFIPYETDNYLILMKQSNGNLFFEDYNILIEAFYEMERYKYISFEEHKN
jgi:hypothetical protein